MNNERLPETPSPPGDETLSIWRKSAFATGDFTLNTALSSLSLLYATYFLTQVADLRPFLAGLVPLIGRVVDAFTDPAMGRLSDRTRWKAGRRRPYLLLGAVPFGLAFALLWTEPGIASQGGRFAYYTVVYCVFSVAMTVLTVPYMALIPEMALGYDERTSLSTFRNVGSLLGVFAAIGIRPLANALGGGSAGFAAAGVVAGVVLALPWLLVHRVTFERPAFRARPAESGLWEGLRHIARHRSFVRLTAIYIAGRIAMDLIGALLILYVTYWLGRSDAFEPLMFLFLLSVVAVLPAWLRFSRGRDKARIFLLGASWWGLCNLLLLLGQPDWPVWLFYAFGPLAAIGYAVVDLMPWAMLGETIDEDDLMSGERREGLYNGVFTFARKLGGAVGVFLILSILDLVGFEKGETQTELTRQTIRYMAAFGPALFLALAVWMARNYPLSRARHDEIRRLLANRDG